MEWFIFAQNSKITQKTTSKLKKWIICFLPMLLEVNFDKITIIFYFQTQKMDYMFFANVIRSKFWQNSHNFLFHRTLLPQTFLRGKIMTIDQMSWAEIICFKNKNYNVIHFENSVSGPQEFFQNSYMHGSFLFLWTLLNYSDHTNQPNLKEAIFPLNCKESIRLLNRMINLVKNCFQK